MKCKDVTERLHDFANEALPASEMNTIQAHTADCSDCRDALQGAMALQQLRSVPLEAAPDGLFERTIQRIDTDARRRPERTGFWLGTAVGGAIAAALALAVVTLGLFGEPVPPGAIEPEFRIALDEPRSMNVAFDLKRPMPAATLSVSLIGGVALVGFENMRDLSWTDDLASGVNKLSLPLIATNDLGGKVLVRLSGPTGQKEFLVNLKFDDSKSKFNATKSGALRLPDKDDGFSHAGAATAARQT